jgi:transposase InsO family protein
MDERVRFVARLLEGERMVALCREFAISRKTGYKIFDRYQESGLEALTDRSRRPWRYGNQLPQQVETAIVNLKREKTHWGARKIRERLLRRFSCEVKVPARSTIHAVLDRHGLVQRRGRKRNHAQGTPLSLGQKPNELWCTDYTGEFPPGNKNYCYPLTVTDHASRFLLLCEALESTRESLAFTAFQRLFQERGLPGSIRSDNGVPFASPNSLFHLSKFLRLGITIERIQPGHPQQNGRHERMHLTLKTETTRPAGLNSLQQQSKFDDFLEEFNTERPHRLSSNLRRPSSVGSFLSSRSPQARKQQYLIACC